LCGPNLLAIVEKEEREVAHTKEGDKRTWFTIWCGVVPGRD